MAVISFDKLTKDYKTGFRKRKTALKDFSLGIREGEVFGFLGPNGAGKSTAIKILLNLIFPSLGKAEILVRSVGLLYFGFLLSLTQIRLNAKLHSMVSLTASGRKVRKSIETIIRGGIHAGYNN